MNITFGANATFPADKVSDFANFLGYSPFITKDVLDDKQAVISFEQAPNPQSVNDFIAQKFKEYCTQFAAGYAIKQVNDQSEIQRLAAVAEAQQAVAAAISVTVQ